MTYGPHSLQFWCYHKVVLLCTLLLLSACGGGGSKDHPPEISNLQYYPQTAYLNDGDGSITVSASVEFYDKDADLSGFSISIFDAQDNLLQILSDTIPGASGIKQGVGGGLLSISTLAVGDFYFEVFLIDAKDNASNILTGSFSIDGPTLVSSSIPDSGLQNCFNETIKIDCPGDGEPFFGQDFQYTANPMTYSDHGDGTVTDLVTTLMWQQSDTEPPTAYNWFQASGTYDATSNDTDIDVCGALNLGGHADWRLPSRFELQSLVDYSQDISVINSDFFSGTGPDYWTRDELTDQARYINFDSGAVLLDAKTSTKYVRCVRGNDWGTGQFTDNGDDTVSDNPSGLMWQSQTQGNQNWENMLSHCEALELAGYDDWRLPDIKELHSLIGSESVIPTNPGIYCSSTTLADDPQSVWLIQFSPSSNYGDVFKHGAGYSKNTCSSFYFRCTRSINTP